jgi:hypothetical protein
MNGSQMRLESRTTTTSGELRRRGPTTSNRMHAGVLNFRNYLVAIFCAHSLFASFLSLSDSLISHSILLV